MQQVSGKIWFLHAWRLMSRHPGRAVLQLLPTCLSGVVFGYAYLLYRYSGTPPQAIIYLVLSILLVLLITFVISFRETSLELRSFYWLHVAGFKRRQVAFICLLKWGLQYLVSIVVSNIMLIVMDNEQGWDANYFGNVLLPVAAVHLLFLTCVLLSVQNYLIYKWKIS